MTLYKPFLKWAGGKTQLLTELHECVPAHYNKYIEPFVGGGAMFFSLNAPRAVIADANEELVLTYNEVKNHVEEVIGLLGTFENSEEFYYRMRGLDVSELDNAHRAARLIYLNKTCFNGLYRVNRKGMFNVPYGKKNGNFLNEEVLRNASAFLRDTEVLQGDYLTVLQRHAEPGDFIFLDPPYHPVGKNADFRRYTKDFFNPEDQVNLKNEFDRLVGLGCHVILTNSNHPVIIDLYRDYETRVVDTKRMISSNATTRTGKDIIVIGNHA